MKRNVSVVRFKFLCNILISGKIIKEMPVSVASGTHCIFVLSKATVCIISKVTADTVYLFPYSTMYCFCKDNKTFFFKKRTKAFGFMNVTLLHCYHHMFRPIMWLIWIDFETLEMYSYSCSNHPEEGYISGRNMSVITMS